MRGNLWKPAEEAVSTWPNSAVQFFYTPLVLLQWPVLCSRPSFLPSFLLSSSFVSPHLPTDTLHPTHTSTATELILICCLSRMLRIQGNVETWPNSQCPNTGAVCCIRFNGVVNVGPVEVQLGRLAWHNYSLFVFSFGHGEKKSWHKRKKNLKTLLMKKSADHTFL